MLLSVSASHWSMFESGQRSLPLHATQTLAALLTHVQQKTAKPSPKNVEAEQTLLKRLLHENAYQQRLAERKLAALDKKLDSQRRLQQVAQYLENQNRQDKKLTPPHHKQLIAKAQKPKPDDGTTRFALELKLELLALEEKLLRSKLEPGSNKE
ncbi:hypothetical protein FLLO111716_13660 [Flavobacterium longum]